tara:strand:- start:1334 stop:1516 length:183 start_codon:yes stop_codon:yes gene_type:complete
MIFASTETDDSMLAVKMAVVLNAAGIAAYIVNHNGEIKCLRACAVGCATIIDIHRAVTHA